MGITRSPYKGDSRKLLLAFDIGTTYSGVCYAFLDPGIVPETKGVTTFLNNDWKDFKIPSVLYYDRDGKFCGAGDAAQWDDDEKPDKIRWWKLKLAEGDLPAEAKRHTTADLPKGKTIVDLFADFIRYLFDSTVEHIKQVEPTGDVLWKNFGPRVELILTHPNGWEGQRQEVMRKAVVKAGIFDEEEARCRVSFVTEGEASFNYCVTRTKPGESLGVDHKVLVIDAGGGTIDISSYAVRGKFPLKVEELYLPKCAYQGAEIVTARARDYAQGMSNSIFITYPPRPFNLQFPTARFKGSKFDTESDIDAFTECFDKGLKCNFSDSTRPKFVKFGGPRDHDNRCGVKDGKLTLKGSQVAKFFKPSVDAILEAIKSVARELDPKNTFVFLVGGFAASPWLFREIGRELAVFGLKLSRPDTQTNKAVAFGAISHYLNHFVTGRLVSYTYGAIACVEFDGSDPEHRQRSTKKRLSAAGELVLEAFTPILFKGTRVSDTEEFSSCFASTSHLPPGAVGPKKLAVIRYKGKREKPRWLDLEPENFETVCHVVADAKEVPCFAFISPMGFPCFVQAYKVVYIYGQTEFKAQLRWEEEDDEKRSDAVILYDEATD